MLTITQDGSIEDPNGKVLYFSTERFVRDICEGNCCFICGVNAEEAIFNNEHILPEWILRKYDLFSRTVGLPNETDFRYDQYTVPCCRDCNDRMGRFFEEPLSQLIGQGSQAISEFLSTNPGGSWHIFMWLALIFIKTHLKDKNLRLHKDRRLPDNKIGDMHEWSAFHHIHCVARSFFTEYPMDPSVHGSLLIWPVKEESYFEPFDYGDLSFAKTIVLRLGDVAFLAVLNDSCAAWNVCQPILQKITGRLSPIQLRELAAHFAFINLNLKERPTYHTKIDSGDTLRMFAQLPDKIELEKPERVQWGTVFYACCRELLSKIENPDKEQIIEYVKQGRWSFLMDSDGRFNSKSMELI